jgi:uncharacterized membrane protein
LIEKAADRLVIYHWKVKEKPPAKPGDAAKPIEDFVAFASFRTTSTSLLFYAFVIVLLGACGSLLAAFVTQPLAEWLAPESAKPRTVLASLLLLVLLFVLITAIAYLAPQAGARNRPFKSSFKRADSPRNDV